MARVEILLISEMERPQNWNHWYKGSRRLVERLVSVFLLYNYETNRFKISLIEKVATPMTLSPPP